MDTNAYVHAKCGAFIIEIMSYHELESVFTNMIVIHLIIDSVSAA